NAGAKKRAEGRGDEAHEAKADGRNIKGPERRNKGGGETERHSRRIGQRAREKAAEGTPGSGGGDERDASGRTRGTGRAA
ncbi:proteasome ATPase, partial [Mycobacterium tuberculosis]